MGRLPSIEEIQVFGFDAFGLDPTSYFEIMGYDRPSRGNELMGAQQVMNTLAPGTPAYNTIAQRGARALPAVREVPLTQMNDVQVPIVVFGTASQTPTASIQLMQLFRPERLFVTEQNNGNGIFNPAQNLILTGAFVGAQNMFPTAPGQGVGIHCATFASNSQGIGINWSSAKPAITVSLQVNFLAIGTFWGCMAGRTIR